VRKYDYSEVSIKKFDQKSDKVLEYISKTVSEILLDALCKE
jgi:hypothetical protein